jgi:hypothetical protein
VANEFSRRPGANSDRVSNARDVEKRWHDPPTLRKAVTYDAAAIVLAGIAFAVYATVDRASVVAASSVPAILLLVRHRCVHEGTRVWRVGGMWPMWQGAGWFLPWAAAAFA